MLYIFHVDTGTMMTFDMNLAMESVAILQGVIARACRIPEDKQVLLVSGGENLDPDSRVGRYSAGTDTNPIFLFSKGIIEAAHPPSPSVYYGSDVDLQCQVEGSLIMPPAYETVVSRAQLAVQFHEVDKEELLACERLVHDQHLQQQGWAAVIANLDDISNAFTQRGELFQDSYADYLSCREQYLVLLNSIGESLQLLTKIPVLHCLLQNTVAEVDADTVMVKDHVSSTLYNWISSQDAQHSLEEMVEHCRKATEQFDERILETLTQEIQQAFEAVANLSMKEVKGLEDRLYGLDQIMSGARRIVQEQSDMSQSFVKNQNRMTNLRDTSILPDLCSSHKKQLIVMLKNHQKLRDIKRKCRVAKEELSVNLHTRLRWVMFVEKKICDVDGKLMIYHENLKRLRKRLDILQQIQNAPQIYAQLVVEVVRRRQFSSEFLEWARELADNSSQLHKDEVSRREAFLVNLGCHFLQAMFRGFDDIPPMVATERPSDFDQLLPPVNASDIDMLRSSVPELSEILRTPHEKSVLEIVHISRINSNKPVLEHSLHRTASSKNVSFTGSDVDILEVESDHHFFTIEGSTISLSEQVADSEPQTDSELQPLFQKLAVKPEFPLPQSLSEDLTQEMKGQGFKGHIGTNNAEGDITLIESTDGKVKEITSSSEGKDATPSSDNDAIVKTAPTRSVKTAGKGNSDISPELETSHEFTTADFYIDESMPSSITDSPANKTSSSDGGEKVQDMPKMLQEKCLLIEKLEQQVLDSQAKLSTSELKHKQFQVIYAANISLLKEDLNKACANFRVLKEEHICYNNDIMVQVNNAILTNNEHITHLHSQESNKMKLDYEAAINKYQDKLGKAETMIDDLTVKITDVNKELTKSRKDMNMLKLESESRVSLLSEMHALELADVAQKQAMLELNTEVEIDSIRSKLEGEITAQANMCKDKCTEYQKLEEKISALHQDKEQKIEEIMERYQTEKEEVVKILEAQHADELALTTTEVRESLEVEHWLALQKLTKEFDDKVEHECDMIRNKVQQEWHNKMEDAVVELEAEHSKALLDLKNAMTKEKHDELDVIKNKLVDATAEFTSKLAEIKAEKSVLEEDFSNLQQSIAVTSTDSQTESAVADTITIDRHEEIMKQIKELSEAQQIGAVEKALTEQQSQHETKISSLLETQEKDKQDSLSSLKTSLTAEKQILFNEAIGKATAEKDKIIDELKQRESSLMEQQQKDRGLISQMTRVNTGQAESSDENMSKSTDGSSIQDMEKELATSRHKVTTLQHQLMEQSQTMMASTSTHAGSPLIGAMSDIRILQLESTLKSKSEEMDKLQQKMMRMSMSVSMRSDKDKVAITSCNMGDLVLLCWDERHDQYVVFTVGKTLHFLHNDYVETLGLKAAAGEPRKSWVLAEVTAKEYCQAKKEINRFKVPLGTKFYRVSVKLWTPEAFPKRDSTHQESKS